MEPENKGNAWVGFAVGGIVLVTLLVFVCAALLASFVIVGRRTTAVSPPGPVLATPSPSGVEPLATVGKPPDGAGEPGQGEEPDQAGFEPEMDAVEEEVADLRELPALADVPRAYLSPDDLHEKVIDDFFADYTREEARDEAIMLAALDAVPPGFDLYGFYVDLYSEGVAGFYDPEEDEFFLVGDDQDFSASDEWVLAHEYTHALQDQHFDLEDFLHYDEDAWHVEHADESAARTALIEGDATLTTWLYATTLMSSERQAEMWDDLDSSTPAIFDDAPVFLLQDFFFPYDQGYLFAQALYAAGGYDLLSQCYDDPPTSTEQILHPERYLSRDAPQEVRLEDALLVLGEDYREVVVRPLGEWYTRLYLEGVLPASQAEQAAAGWDGDRLAVYVDEDDGRPVMVLRSVWDDANEAAEFGALFEAFGTERAGGAPAFGVGGATCWQGDDVLCLLRLGSDGTVVVRAPERQTAGGVLAQYAQVAVEKE
jgi:hypothetical protein